jgi:hypothetical protein
VEENGEANTDGPGSARGSQAGRVSLPAHGGTSKKVTSKHQAIVSELGSRGPFGHQASAQAVL